MDSLPAADITWMLVCSALVFFLQAGFCCMECGLTRSKNNINAAMKNIADFCISGALFWLTGYAFLYGRSWCGLIGASDFVFEETGSSTWLTVFFTYQLMYCGTTSTIASGAVAERMRFQAYAAMSAVIGGIIYPIFGHWVWSRPDLASEGWLAKLGFVDFAGSTVVHGSAAWAALAAVVVLGPRTGKFPEQGPPRQFHGSSLPLAALGLFILWFGWLGFVGGKAYALNDLVPELLINTLLAGVFGGLGNLIFQFVFRKQVSIESFMNGIVAGLVAVCASCNLASDNGAILIGLSAGLVVEAATYVIERRLWLDDGIGAIAVHGVAGAWGTLLTPLAATPALLPAETHLPTWLGIQALGVAVNFCWSFGVCFVALKVIAQFIPLRVSEEEERIGLNYVEHGAVTDLHDLLTTMERNMRGDMSRRATEDPSTEAGMVALMYNRVLDAREQSLHDLQHYASKLEATNTQVEKQAVELQVQAIQLEQSRSEAERANETKSLFLANMSHEIRTPMTSILGYVDVMLEEVAGRECDQLFAAPLKTIKRNGNHLLDVINDILDISKIEAGRLTIERIEAPLPQIIDDVTHLLRHRAEEKGLVLHVRYLTPVPERIHTDPTRLRQILLNLVGNSLKFTQEGEVRIDISLVAEAGRPPQVDLAVVDTGIGLTDDQMSRLFQPFVQADNSTTRKFGGTGLGLTISRRLAQMLGGDIHVSSVFGEGSRFAVRVPAGEVANVRWVQPAPSLATRVAQNTAVAKNQPWQEPLFTPTPVAAATATTAAPRIDCRILLAEDGPDNQRLISFVLRKAGADVALAENGLAAVELAQQAARDGARFDIILMDMLMPVLDGCQATLRLRSEGYTGVIIALTANAMQEDRERCLAAGCDDFCTKPIDRTQLVATIHRHLSTQAAVQAPAETL